MKRTQAVANGKPAAPAPRNAQRSRGTGAIVRALAIGLLFGASGCYANSVVVLFTGLPTSVENGTYNGFAEATVNGVPKQLLICDDETHTTYVPSSELIYDYADFHATQTSLSSARFIDHNGPTEADVLRYKEAAVLLYGLVHAAPDAATVSDYQYAIWNLFTPSVTLYRPAQSALQAHAIDVIHTASPTYLDGVYSSMRIYTPHQDEHVNFSSNQEFLQYNGVPEPSFLMPLGGLLVWAVKRRALRAV